MAIALLNGMSLRQVMLLDAVASGAMAILLIVGAGFLASLLGLSAPFLFWVGLVLVPWTLLLLLLLLSRREVIGQGAAAFVVVINVLWVVASIAVMIGGFFSINTLGYVFIIAQAAAVGLFAELQFLGMRRASA